MLEVTNDLKLN